MNHIESVRKEFVEKFYDVIFGSTIADMTNFITQKHLEYLKAEIEYFKSQGIESWDDNPGAYKQEIARKEREIKLIENK